MIKINRIKEEPCSLYFKNSQNELIFLGIIENNLEYQDICLQIAKENSDRYCILFKEVFYDINRFGMIPNYPKGLFDKITDLVCDTMLTGINIRKAEKMENYNYVPEFTTTKRNGKIALWVKMPDNTKYNLGDISEQDFKKEEIKFAIICAFERGMNALKQIIQNELYKQFTCFNEKFDK